MDPTLEQIAQHAAAIQDLKIDAWVNELLAVLPLVIDLGDGKSRTITEVKRDDKRVILIGESSFEEKDLWPIYVSNPPLVRSGQDTELKVVENVESMILTTKREEGVDVGEIVIDG